MAEEKRVWLYLRVGMTASAQMKLDGRKKELLDFTARQGWSVTGSVIDIGTGPRLTRISLAELMRAAQNGEYDILLIDKIRSICKDRLQALSVLAAIQARGVEIHCREEGGIDVVKEAQALREHAVAAAEETVPTPGAIVCGDSHGEEPILGMT